MLETILLSLPQLKPNQLLAIKARVEFLLGQQAATEALSDWLTAGILEELKRRGLGYGPRWYLFAPKSYGQEAHAIRQTLLAKINKPLATAEQYALGRLAARALADYLNKVAPLSLKMMFQSVKLTSTALDDSYPGYLEAGKIEFLLRGK